MASGKAFDEYFGDSELKKALANLLGVQRSQPLVVFGLRSHVSTIAVQEPDDISNPLAELFRMWWSHVI